MSRRMRNVAITVSLLLGLVLFTHSVHPIPNLPEIPKLPKLQSPFVTDDKSKKPSAAAPSRYDHGKIPRRVWQTWRDPPMGLADDYREWTSTWIQKNPDYRYELLTDATAMSFVETFFHDRPDIIDTFRRTEDIILRADYLRYLAVYAEGGTYVDMDTDCTVPIDKWIPSEYANQTSFVVGIEYDALEDGIRSDFEDRVQLCQWAFMAKPGDHVLGHIINRVTKALQALAPNGGKIIVQSNDDVLHVTGPRIFSYAIFEELSKHTKRNITVDDLTGMTGPKLVGDTLVLPINAFGSGQLHSNSGEKGNDGQLLWHHFNGFWGWKDAHDGARQREKEAQEKAEAEAKEAAEAAKKAEEEAKLKAEEAAQAKAQLEAAASAVTDYMAPVSATLAASVAAEHLATILVTDSSTPPMMTHAPAAAAEEHVGAGRLADASSPPPPPPVGENHNAASEAHATQIAGDVAAPTAHAAPSHVGSYQIV